MALHPKITVFGLLLGGAVGAGLILFLLGRLTAGAGLGTVVAGAASGLGLLVIAGWAVVTRLPGSRVLAGVLHADSQPSWDGYVSATARPELIGRSGVSVTELRPSGVAEFDGERVDVTTDGEWLPTGTPVTVVKAEAMRVVVKRVPQLPA